MTNYSAQGIVLVKRKPATADEAVLNQKVSVITAEKMKSGKVSDFTQLFKDLDTAGIFVNSDGNITLRGNVKVVNGSTTVALFTGGKLNANLINADTITVNHLYAKSGQNGSVVGHFGNYDKSDAVAGDDKCPLWLGAAIAANAPFRVTKEGAMYATAGEIGGFKINNSSIGSADVGGSIRGMHLSSEHLIFNTSYGQGIFGAFFLTGGFCYGSRVELNGGQNNIGLYINTKSSGTNDNFAIYAEKGNIVSKGLNASIKYSHASLTAGKWDPFAINLRENNVWFLSCYGGNTYLVLPSLSTVRKALKIENVKETFCVRITIVGSKNCTAAFRLTGRSDDSSDAWYSSDYPWLYDEDANNTSFEMGAGDSCELLLVFDGTTYFAQLLSLKR